MRLTILIFWMAFSLSSCSDDDKSKQEVTIIGKWQLIETYGSSGGAGQWTTVEDGYTYSFENSNILISNRFSCNGTYVEDSDSLTISFDCPENQFNLTYGISFENSSLILTPDPVNCDEGCAEKYQRVE